MLYSCLNTYLQQLSNHCYHKPGNKIKVIGSGAINIANYAYSY